MTDQPPCDHIFNLVAWRHHERIGAHCSKCGELKLDLVAAPLAVPGSAQSLSDIELANAIKESARQACANYFAALAVRTGEPPQPDIWPSARLLLDPQTPQQAVALAVADGAFTRWNTAALLKDRTRIAIRERHAAGESIESLAADFDVPEAFVSMLVAWQMFRDDPSQSDKFNEQHPLICSLLNSISPSLLNTPKCDREGTPTLSVKEAVSLVSGDYQGLLDDLAKPHRQPFDEIKHIPPPKFHMGDDDLPAVGVDLPHATPADVDIRRVDELLAPLRRVSAIQIGVMGPTQHNAVLVEDVRPLLAHLGQQQANASDESAAAEARYLRIMAAYQAEESRAHEAEAALLALRAAINQLEGECVEHADRISNAVAEPSDTRRVRAEFEGIARTYRTLSRRLAALLVGDAPEGQPGYRYESGTGKETVNADGSLTLHLEKPQKENPE